MSIHTLPSEVDAPTTLGRVATALGHISWLKQYSKVEIRYKQTDVMKTLGDYESVDAADRLVTLLNTGNKGKEIARLTGPYSQLVIELGALEGGVV